MTFPKVRYLKKFQSLTEEFEFPQYRYEFEPGTQDLAAPVASVIGGGYAIDLLGGAQAIEEVSLETVRFAVFDSPDDANTLMDEMYRLLFTPGVGRLWTETDDDYDPPRWCWARLVSMPGITVSGLSYHETPVVLRFVRLSRWFGQTQISVSNLVNSNGETWNVNNPGNLPVRAMVITLRPQASGGIPADFTVLNQENDNEFQMTHASASTNDRRRLNTNQFLVESGALVLGPAVEQSDDAGASWTSDISNYEFPPSPQRLLSFQLEPGDNTLQGNGTSPNVNVDIVFYPEFLR